MPEQPTPAPLSVDAINNSPSFKAMNPAQQAFWRRAVFNDAVRPTFAGRGTSPEATQAIHEWLGTPLPAAPARPIDNPLDAAQDSATRYLLDNGPTGQIRRAITLQAQHATDPLLKGLGLPSWAEHDRRAGLPGDARMIADSYPTNPLAEAGETVGSGIGMLADPTNKLFGAAKVLAPVAPGIGTAIRAGLAATPRNAIVGGLLGGGTTALEQSNDGQPLDMKAIASSALGMAALGGGASFLHGAAPHVPAGLLNPTLRAPFGIGVPPVPAAYADPGGINLLPRDAVPGVVGPGEMQGAVSPNVASFLQASDEAFARHQAEVVALKLRAGQEAALPGIPPEWREPALPSPRSGIPAGGFDPALDAPLGVQRGEGIPLGEAPGGRQEATPHTPATDVSTMSYQDRVDAAKALGLDEEAAHKVASQQIAAQWFPAPVDHQMPPSQNVTPQENVNLGHAALDRVLGSGGDAKAAMHLPDYGDVDFLWGNKDAGIQHILQKHGENGVRAIPEALTYGDRGEPYGHQPDRQRINIDHDGNRVVMGLHRDGARQNWVVTSFERTPNKMTPDATEQGLGLPRSYAPRDYTVRPEEGAGVDPTLHQNEEAVQPPLADRARKASDSLEQAGQARLDAARKDTRLGTAGGVGGDLLLGHAQLLASRMMRGAVSLASWISEARRALPKMPLDALKAIYDHAQNLAYHESQGEVRPGHDDPASAMARDGLAALEQGRFNEGHAKLLASEGGHDHKGFGDSMASLHGEGVREQLPAIAAHADQLLGRHTPPMEAIQRAADMGHAPSRAIVDQIEREHTGMVGDRVATNDPARFGAKGNTLTRANDPQGVAERRAQAEREAEQARADEAHVEPSDVSVNGHSLADHLAPNSKHADTPRVMRWADGLEAQGRARLEAARKTTNVGTAGGVGGDLLRGHTEVLAAQMLRGAVKFTEWSKEMIAEHGPAFAQHLRGIWNDALAIKDAHEREVNGGGSMPEGSANPLSLTTSPDVAKALKAGRTRIARLQRIADEATAQGNTHLANTSALKIKEVRGELANLHANALATADKATMVAQKITNDQPAYDGGKFAGHTNVDRMAVSDDAKGLLQKFEQEFQPQIDSARGGVVSREETGKLAREIGMTPEQLFKMRKGEAMNHAQITSARNLLASSAETVTSMGKAIANGGDSQKALAEFAEAVALHAKIQAKVAGATTEIARALAAHNIASKAGAQQVKAIKTIIEKSGGHEALREMASLIANAANDAQVAAITRNQVGVLKTIVAARNAGLILSFKTLEKVSGAHALSIAFEGLTRTLAAGIDDGLVRAHLSEQGDRTILAPSAAKALAAFRKAKSDGLSQSWDLLRTGIAKDDQYALSDTHAFETSVKGLKFLEPYINMVNHAHAADYHPFKVYALERTLQDQAELVARAEVRRDPSLDFQSRIDHWKANPTDEMQMEAVAGAEHATFQEPNIVSDALRGFKTNLNRASPAAGDFFDLDVPFKHVPSNIFVRTLDYMGIGGALRAIGGIEARKAANRELLAALNPEEQAAVSMAAARGLVGGAMLLSGYFLGRAGLMTGAYSAATEKQNELANRSAASIKIAGRWWPMLEVPGLSVAVVGATLARDGFTLPGYLAGAAHIAANSPMLQGGKGLMDAANDPSRMAGRFAASMAGSFVPTGVADLAKMADTTNQKRAISHDWPKSAADTIASRVPFARNTLPVKPNGLGQPVPTVGLGPANASNIIDGRQAWEDHDPLVKEMVRLGTNVPSAPKAITYDKHDIPLTPDLARKWEVIRGDAIRHVMTNAMSTAAYQGMTDAERLEAFNHAMPRIAASVKDVFIAHNVDELRAQLAGAAPKVRASHAQPVQDSSDTDALRASLVQRGAATKF